MKYTKANKWLRNDTWYSVLPPKVSSMKAAKLWCDNYRFGSKFYYHYTNTRWWFEEEHDAVMFSLMWSGK